MEIQYEQLNQVPFLRYGTIANYFGTQKLSFSDNSEHYRRSMHLLRKTNNIKNVFGVKQIHSNIIRIIKEEDLSAGHHLGISRADGLITDLEDVALVIKTADCCPVFVYEQEKKVVALLHAGREGTRKKILTRCCEIIEKEYGGNTDNLLLKLGPHICGSCYEVNEEIAEEFQYSGIKPVRDGYFLSLKDNLIREAINLGIGSIEFDGRCSHESNELYSYRNGDHQDRNLSFIFKRRI